MVLIIIFKLHKWDKLFRNRSSNSLFQMIQEKTDSCSYTDWYSNLVPPICISPMLLLCYFITWSKLTPFGPRLYIVLLYIRSSNTGWCEKNLSYFPLFSNLVPPILNCTRVFQTWNHGSSHCQINIVNSHKHHSIYILPLGVAGEHKSTLIVYPLYIHPRSWSKTSSIMIRERATQKMGDVVAKGPNQENSKTEWVIQNDS